MHVVLSFYKAKHHSCGDCDSTLVENYFKSTQHYHCHLHFCHNYNIGLVKECHIDS